MTSGIEIQRVADEDALGRAAADLFVHLARQAVGDRGRFTVVLSGGSTPRRMLEQLAAPPFRNQIPWDRIDFFWSDERTVPPDHDDSNYRMARAALLEHVPVPPERIHRMEAERPDLDEAAAAYQREIADVLGVDAAGAPPALDLIFLGMGADGHTASLFPHTAALRETERWVVPNDVAKLDAHRLTMTPAIINRARCVAFLVQGDDKAERLVEVLEGPPDPDRLPSQWIRPVSGQLIWLVDRAAASRLSRSHRAHR